MRASKRASLVSVASKMRHCKGACLRQDAVRPIEKSSKIFQGQYRSEAKGTNDLEWLYFDLNSYFASVEQQLNPELRGKPIAVIPTETDATCAIAASYEAKAYGIKTGTKVYEAKRLCPELICVMSGHEKYVEYHHRILKEIEKHIPIERVESIDEVSCRLTGSWKNREKALSIAHAIKNGVAANVGEYLTSSIGIAPNSFLAKVATELEKPNGLQVIHLHELPHRLYELGLRDLPGIGQSMHERLLRVGVGSIEQLYNLEAKRMRKVWHSVAGERMYHRLRGMEIPHETGDRRTVGHSHVIGPEFRPAHQARKIARRLCSKAASRLRRLGYYATSMVLSIRVEDGPRYATEIQFYRSYDTPTLLMHLDHLWCHLMHATPKRIKKASVTMMGLVPEEEVKEQQCLLDIDPLTDATRDKRESLSHAMDTLNAKYGRDTVVMGEIPHTVKSFSGTKVAFTRIPDIEEFHE